MLCYAEKKISSICIIEVRMKSAYRAPIGNVRKLELQRCCKTSDIFYYMS